MKETGMIKMCLKVALQKKQHKSPMSHTSSYQL